MKPTENSNNDSGNANNEKSSNNGSLNNGSSNNGSSNNGSSNNGSSNNGSLNNGSSNNGSSNANRLSNNGSSNNGSSNNGSSNANRLSNRPVIQPPPQTWSANANRLSNNGGENQHLADNFSYELPGTPTPNTGINAKGRLLSAGSIQTMVSKRNYNKENRHRRGCFMPDPTLLVKFRDYTPCLIIDLVAGDGSIVVSYMVPPTLPAIYEMAHHISITPISGISNENLQIFAKFVAATKGLLDNIMKNILSQCALIQNGLSDYSIHEGTPDEGTPDEGTPDFYHETKYRECAILAGKSSDAGDTEPDSFLSLNQFSSNGSRGKYPQSTIFGILFANMLHEWRMFIHPKYKEGCYRSLYPNGMLPLHREGNCTDQDIETWKGQRRFYLTGIDSGFSLIIELYDSESGLLLSRAVINPKDPISALFYAVIKLVRGILFEDLKGFTALPPDVDLDDDKIKTLIEMGMTPYQKKFTSEEIILHKKRQQPILLDTKNQSFGIVSLLFGPLILRVFGDAHPNGVQAGRVPLTTAFQNYMIYVLMLLQLAISHDGITESGTRINFADRQWAKAMRENERTFLKDLNITEFQHVLYSGQCFRENVRQGMEGNDVVLVSDPFGLSSGKHTGSKAAAAADPLAWGRPHGDYSAIDPDVVYPHGSKYVSHVTPTAHLIKDGDGGCMTLDSQGNVQTTLKDQKLIIPTPGMDFPHIVNIPLFEGHRLKLYSGRKDTASKITTFELPTFSSPEVDSVIYVNEYGMIKVISRLNDKDFMTLVGICRDPSKGTLPQTLDTILSEFLLGNSSVPDKSLYTSFGVFLGKKGYTDKLNQDRLKNYISVRSRESAFILENPTINPVSDIICEDGGRSLAKEIRDALKNHERKVKSSELRTASGGGGPFGGASGGGGPFFSP